MPRATKGALRERLASHLYNTTLAYNRRTELKLLYVNQPTTRSRLLKGSCDRQLQVKIVLCKSAYNHTDAQGVLQVGFELGGFVRDGPSEDSFSARLENK